MRKLIAQLDADGFAWSRGVLSESECATILESLPPVSRGGRRNLLSLPQVVRLAMHPLVASVAQRLLGTGAIPYRATLFDKGEHANWSVPWHQDVCLPVQERGPRKGWSGWSEKAGVLHAQPPPAILAGILALRVHLDLTPAENGALQVIPGSHLLGRLHETSIAALVRRRSPVICAAVAGDLLWLRPLLLHASFKAVKPSHRRVLHLEFAPPSIANGPPVLAAA